MELVLVHDSSKIASFFLHALQIVAIQYWCICNMTLVIMYQKSSHHIQQDLQLINIDRSIDM